MQRSDRIGRGLKLKDLHTFCAVVGRGSMAKAADDLALTLSAITKVIGDMKTLLGVSLIDRLSRQHARMGFRVKQGNSNDELYRWLRARAIDVFVGRISMDPEEDIEKEALFDDPLVVVTGRDNPRFRGRGVKLEHLMDEVWCMPQEPHIVGTLIGQAFRANGLALPDVCVSCASMPMQAALAQTGRFFTVMPASYLRFSSNQDSLRIVPVNLKVSPPPVSFATLRHRRVSPATKLFIETLRAVAKGAK
jgi:DNA-binding transcriptional LysR family regulator